MAYRNTHSAAIEAAWREVVWDCGCPDVYFCPTSMQIECPRHSGFDVCCDRIDDHLAVRDLKEEIR